MCSYFEKWHNCLWVSETVARLRDNPPTPNTAFAGPIEGPRTLAWAPLPGFGLHCKYIWTGVFIPNPQTLRTMKHHHRCPLWKTGMKERGIFKKSSVGGWLSHHFPLCPLSFCLSSVTLFGSILTVVVVTQLCTSVKTCRTVH